MTGEAVAILVSLLALGVSLVSASYARRQAVAVEAQNRRKDPVLEVLSSNDMRKDILGEGFRFYEGYFSSQIKIRNLESSVSLRVIRLEALKGAKIAKLEDLLNPDQPEYEAKILAELPKEAFKTSVIIGSILQPQGSPKAFNGTITDGQYLSIYSTKKLSPGTIRLVWEWTDGKKK